MHEMTATNLLVEDTETTARSDLCAIDGNFGVVTLKDGLEAGNESLLMKSLVRIPFLVPC
jgi:hypothetical protein